MANCVNLSDIDEAVSCADIDNIAGTSAQVEIGFADEVESWPSFPAPSGESSMSFDEAGTLSENLVLKTAATTCTLTFTRDTGEFTMTEQGEAGGENVLYKLSLDRSKMNAKVFGFMNSTRGRRLWVRVVDKNGTQYLMGDKTNQAYRVAADAATTGKAQTDINKVPISFEYVCPRHLVFTGSIQKGA